MGQIDTILFDWDGTLVDTSEAAFVATQSVFGALGIFLDRELYERIYSPNWHHIYEALHLPRQKWEAADNLWLNYYGEGAIQMGDEERRTLSSLFEKYCLGIVTSANRVRVDREINALGVADYFMTVVSGDDVQNRKPHPEGLETAMKLICKQPQRCCYVGDSPEDIEMGRRAGVLTIGISSRYPGSRKILSAGPDFFIGAIAQIYEILKS
jgi:phosphoglycolate phosphatase-like HAD superfamily hydrolase